MRSDPEENPFYLPKPPKAEPQLRLMTADNSSKRKRNAEDAGKDDGGNKTSAKRQRPTKVKAKPDSETDELDEKPEIKPEAKPAKPAKLPKTGAWTAEKRRAIAERIVAAGIDALDYNAVAAQVCYVCGCADDRPGSR